MKPLFSIITVVYNGEAVLEGTLQSVAAQTYPHIEYVVIDGASKDGTAALISSYTTLITRHLSEPDKGLYDAMNKGLGLATGDFVFFLNAGDRLFAPDTLERVAAACLPDTDVLYGEVMLVNDNRQPLGTRSQITTQRLPNRLTWRSLWMGMVVSHQGIFVRRTLAQPYLAGNLCADIDWVIKALRQSRRNTRTDCIITEYLTGGLSKKRHRQSLRDRFAVLRSHYGLPLTLLAHGLIAARAAWQQLLGKAKY